MVMANFLSTRRHANRVIPLKNAIAKKAIYDKLVEKVKNIDTSGVVLKTK